MKYLLFLILITLCVHCCSGQTYGDLLDQFETYTFRQPNNVETTGLLLIGLGCGVMGISQTISINDELNPLMVFGLLVTGTGAITLGVGGIRYDRRLSNSRNL